MSDRKTAAVILAAGKGTRMKSTRHKVLHPVGGQPMILYLIDTLSKLGLAQRILVVGAGREQLASAMIGHDVELAVQEPQLGTGHAVMAAMDTLDGDIDDVLVLYGDTPFLEAETLLRLLSERRRPLEEGTPPAIAVLGFRPADPGGYGRLVVDAHGRLARIVEARDASDAERTLDLCNSGVMAVEGPLLASLLARVRNDNAKGEYYLTDIVALARRDGRQAVVVEAAEAELLGINSQQDLAAAEAVFQAQARARAMEAGVRLTAPETVFFSFDTELGPDVEVEPYVVFGRGVTVESGAVIRAFSHLEGAHVANGAMIGPYARLRQGSVIGKQARVGNFVEIKKATLEAGAKANHLAYLGDAHIGEKANIGAGTITCNYDGFEKSRTEVEAGAFIGSNSSLVAPVRIGRGAIVGAGSAIGGEVPGDALALTRAERVIKDGWAARFRRRKTRRSEGNGG